MTQLHPLVCVGASAGGLKAIKTFLQYLPSTYENPILIVQHMKKSGLLDFSLIFGSSYHGQIVEVTDKTPIECSTAYFAPPDYHVLVEKDWTFSLSQDPPVCYSRPSINVTMESALWSLGHTKVIGVILTGANDDGAESLSLLEQNGASICVQYPKEAEYDFMPLAAIQKTKNPMIGNIVDIVDHLNSKEEL